MFLKKYRQLLAGVIIGLLCALPCGALAKTAQHTFTWVTGQLSFVFDGEKKVVPVGYSVFLCNDQTYVPARFLAEQLGATVDWEQTTKSVKINKRPCNECLVLQKEKRLHEKTIIEQEEKINVLQQEINALKKTMGEKENKEPGVEGQPSGNYQKLPLTRVLPALNIAVTSLVEGDHYPRIYLELENKKETPLQLLHAQTTAIVDGKEYRTADILHFALDQRWYHDLAHEEMKEGYVMLPLLPKGSREMLLKLEFLYNDVAQKTETMEFAIKLNP